MHDEVRRFLPNSVRRVTEDTVDWLRNRHKVEREARREGAAAKRRPSVRVFRGSGPQRHSGFARAIDGDTLEVDGVRVRLHGIDAPEYEQPCWFHGRHWLCGREATRVLANQLHDRQVVCEIRDRDVYGRVVATCSIAGGDLNAWMVAEGWAFAYRRYSRAYLPEESRARAAKRGIWRGEVLAPWDWRKGKRLAGTKRAAQTSSRRCKIKGNISKNGKRIYHVPGGRYHGQTRIDSSRGERWFCTERDARAAGWRRSRQ